MGKGKLGLLTSVVAAVTEVEVDSVVGAVTASDVLFVDEVSELASVFVEKIVSGARDAAGKLVGIVSDVWAREYVDGGAEAVVLRVVGEV